MSDSLRPHEQHTRSPCPSLLLRIVIKLLSIEPVIPSIHLILCRLLLLLPSIFPCIRVFSNESALHMRWPNDWSFSLSIPSIHLILCHLLLLPSISPHIRVFSNESALCMRWTDNWSFSLSISPSNEYSGLILFAWTSWIPLQPKGISRVFSNTTVQKHQFFCAQLSLQSNSHIHM